MVWCGIGQGATSEIAVHRLHHACGSVSCGIHYHQNNPRLTPMYSIEQLPEFEDWFNGLRDRTTKNRLLARLARVEMGNFGDHKTIEGQLLELRMTFGGGLRIYFVIRGNCIVLLLQGGDKSSQPRDIEKAKQRLSTLECTPHEKI
jgi:putative addiction module killer protein